MIAEVMGNHCVGGTGALCNWQDCGCHKVASLLSAHLSCQEVLAVCVWLFSFQREISLVLHYPLLGYGI